ncbi:MAG: helix-turn-helix domain-containing protein [Thermoanaerobaculia bacterium]
MVRIERAKQLLVEEPRHRITDISLDVGFGDLSHFEKTFKRIVKISPREYRRRQLEELRKRGSPAREGSSRAPEMAG